VTEDGEDRLTPVRDRLYFRFTDAELKQLDALSAPTRLTRSGPVPLVHGSKGPAWFLEVGVRGLQTARPRTSSGLAMRFPASTASLGKPTPEG